MSDSKIRDCDPWTVSKEDILDRMTKDGGWFLFGDYDNTKAVFDLLSEGKIHLDPSYDNHASLLSVSLRARISKPPHGA